jgi:hypothetical protein
MGSVSRGCGWRTTRLLRDGHGTSVARVLPGRSCSLCLREQPPIQTEFVLPVRFSPGGHVTCWGANVGRDRARVALWYARTSRLATQRDCGGRGCVSGGDANTSGRGVRYCQQTKRWTPTVPRAIGGGFPPGGPVDGACARVLAQITAVPTALHNSVTVWV